MYFLQSSVRNLCSKIEIVFCLILLYGTEKALPVQLSSNEVLELLGLDVISTHNFCSDKKEHQNPSPL